jgi:predicted RND superfamily exporter protein
VFRRAFARTGDAVRAVEEALQSTGRAILYTSFVLTLGFAVFTLSSMNNLRAFGLLTSFAIASAFVLDVLATPALLVLLFSRRTAQEDR